MGNLGKKKNHVEFIQEIEELIENEYSVLGEYKNNKTKIKMRHNICNYTWDVLPSNFLRGSRCPKCSGNIKKKHEEFIKEVYNLVGSEYEVLGKYINTNTPVKFKHIECGYEWNVRPMNFLNKGSRCPICSFEITASKQRKNNETFLMEVNSLVGNDYLFLDTYKNCGTHLKILHRKCNTIYEVTPNNFLRGYRCPICNESKGEKRIRGWLISNNIEFISQQEFDGLLGLGGGNLSYDFYLSKQNILIEYQGEFHDGTANKQSKEEFEYQKEHDRRKREFAANNDIQLLEIWYWDFENIEEILKNKLENENIYI